MACIDVANRWLSFKTFAAFVKIMFQGHDITHTVLTKTRQTITF